MTVSAATHTPRLLAGNGNAEKILVEFFDQMPEIQSLIKNVPRDILDEYLQKYDGFDYYMRTLSNLAEGISDGTINVPK